MPDHQIVIKLDSDQFDEAQKQAKAAGFRSASSFIRDKIVSIIEQSGLSPEGFLELFPEIPSKIRKIDNDISRIQQELQVFISESEQTTLDMISEPHEQVETISKPEPDFPIFSDKVGATFSPRQEAKDSDISEINDATTYNTIDHRTTLPDPAKNEKEKQTWRLSDNTVSEEVVDEDNPISDAIEVTTARTENIETNPQLQKPKEVPELEEVLEAVNEANDELEEMADRAFSISPRLGSIESKPNQVELMEDDPLADLLDEHLVDKIIAPSQSSTGDQVEDLEEEKELEEPETEIEEQEQEQEQEENSSESEAPPIEPAKSDEIASADENELESEETSQTEKEDDDFEDEDSNPLPSLDPEDSPEDRKPKHDLSSGPPPKKRKN